MESLPSQTLRQEARANKAMQLSDKLLDSHSFMQGLSLHDHFRPPPIHEYLSMFLPVYDDDPLNGPTHQEMTGVKRTTADKDLHSQYKIALTLKNSLVTPFLPGLSEKASRFSDQCHERSQQRHNDANKGTGQYNHHSSKPTPEEAM